jgi:hypothetical protein
MPNEGKSEASAWSIPDPRPDLAFPKLTEDMVEGLRTYGKEETFPANIALFTHGQRGADMFVVLDGQIDAKAVHLDHPVREAWLQLLPAKRAGRNEGKYLKIGKVRVEW